MTHDNRNRRILREVAAVLLAAIIGTAINALAVALVVSFDRLALAYDPGRYGVALLLCLTLPVFARAVSARVFYPTGIAVLTIGASLLAKLVFAAPAPWIMVIAFNLVFAVAAVLTYRAAGHVMASSSAPA